jgi:hypothetical protein
MEAPNAFLAQSSLGEIATSGFGVGGFEEAAMKLIFGPSHGAQQCPFIAGAGHRWFAGPARDGRPQGNAGPFGKHLQCWAELQPFDPHNKAEYVAADLANPAPEDLALRIYLQAGPRVVVPRTVAHVVTTLAAEWDVTAHQVDDIDRLANLLFSIEAGRETHDSGPP